MAAADWLWAAAAPLAGSFLALLAVRLPAGETVVWGRSRCRGCGTALAPWQLVPLASWLWQRGRCAACRGPVAAFYPLMEAAALLVALWALALGGRVPVGASCALGWTLLVLAAIDRRHFLLPDALTLPLLAGGLLWHALAPGGAAVSALAGTAAGGGLLAGLALLYRRLRGRAGLGLGDAKLLAAGGAWVGLEGLPAVLLAASLSGLLTALVLRKGRQDAVAFGPHLAAAIWLAWLYGPINTQA